MDVLEKLSEILRDYNIQHEVKDEKIILYLGKRDIKDGLYEILIGDIILKTRVSVENQDRDENYAIIEIKTIRGLLEEDMKEKVVYRILSWLENSGYISRKI